MGCIAVCSVRRSGHWLQKRNTTAGFLAAAEHLRQLVQHPLGSLLTLVQNKVISDFRPSVRPGRQWLGSFPADFENLRTLSL
ncbi:hypothetical protein PoB_007350200 [Plakobranchus ocellatus]|uniref:Uncharacterized protein n=1 Tax=Plakobranchus ocellatus TaxID=259542 RepID=A0AAV4DRP9_9GAST|nr:hypothetical protein PoB_007350200 [Plakobranchus ocellatus]